MGQHRADGVALVEFVVGVGHEHHGKFQSLALDVRVLKEDMTEIELQEGSETINESLTSVIESSPDDNNYKDESNLGEYGYKESTLEEEAGQADAQPEFTEMPFGDSDL